MRFCADAKSDLAFSMEFANFVSYSCRNNGVASDKNKELPLKWKNRDTYEVV